MNYIRRLTGLSSATTNDLAHIDIGVNSYIILVQFDIAPTPPGLTGDQLYAELSTASIAQPTLNDAQGILAHASYNFTFTAAGAAFLPINVVVGPVMIPIRAGTRLYLHHVHAGTTSTRTRVNVHFQS